MERGASPRPGHASSADAKAGLRVEETQGSRGMGDADGLSRRHAVVAALHGEVRVALRVPPHVFVPTPKVDSAVAAID